MNFILNEFETPYESLMMQIETFLQGGVIEINAEESLDLPEELDPKIQIQLKKEQGSTKVLQVQFSVYHEDMSDVIISAETVMKLNQLIKFLVLHENVELIADLVKNMSGYYLVIQYKERIEIENNPDGLNKSYWEEKLNNIINALLFLKSATTTSSGGLILALKRAILHTRLEGGYRKHCYWQPLKRGSLTIFFP